MSTRHKAHTRFVKSFGLLGLFALALSLVLFAVPMRGVAASANTSDLWVVAFNQTNGLPSNVDQIVAAAGGTIISRLPEIGGIGVQSSNPNFATTIAANSQVKSADSATTVQLIDPADQGAVAPASSDNNGGNFSPAGPDPQPGSEPLYNQQWDKMRMNVSDTGSYAIQRGNRNVRVAVIDTGADQTHPDIAPNLDVALSRSFVPSEPTIQDFNGHGSWTISAVGAPINGVGISGVAPNVTLVSLKVLSGTGSGLFIWTDQALVYAGLNHFDIASMSLGGYIPKCGSNTNPGGCDHPDYILLNRALQFARQNGVLPVAALGNDNFDLSDGSFFRDYVEAPGEMPGVVGVSATGYYNRKSYYSNYGMGKADVAAPGGDRRFQDPPPNYLFKGRLVGAWSSTASSTPPESEEDCSGSVCAIYAWIQGTSMATPNAAGVAALIISQYGDFTPNNQNKPHMSPTAVEQILQISANNQPCPQPNTVVYPAQPPDYPGATATCQGDVGYNSFYGKGIVDAVRAVTTH
jgi:subtilisin family serine protease